MSILKDLYAGYYMPCELSEPGTEEYSKIKKELSQSLAALRNELSTELNDHLDQVLNYTYILNGISEFEHFRQGAIFGARISRELFDSSFDMQNEMG